MRPFCFMLVVFLLSQLGCAQETEGKLPVKNAVTKVLHPFFTEYVDGERYVLKYCPELPCELIKVNAKVNKEIAYDFALLFYLFDTTYPEFREDKYMLPSGLNPYTELRNFVPPVVHKYEKSGTCSDADEKEMCVMQYLKDKYKIETILIVEKG